MHLESRGNEVGLVDATDEFLSRRSIHLYHLLIVTEAYKSARNL